MSNEIKTQALYCTLIAHSGLWNHSLEKPSFDATTRLTTDSHRLPICRLCEKLINSRTQARLDHSRLAEPSHARFNQPYLSFEKERAGLPQGMNLVAGFTS
jgi:hypothetical protein